MATKQTAGSLGAKLPEGYEPIQGGSFGDTWDFTKRRNLEGVVKRLDSTTMDQGKKNEREQRVLELETKEGERISVWESATLRDLFDAVTIGSQIALAYAGEKAVKGRRQPMHNILAGIKGGAPQRANGATKPTKKSAKPKPARSKPAGKPGAPGRA